MYHPTYTEFEAEFDWALTVLQVDTEYQFVRDARIDVITSLVGGNPEHADVIFNRLNDEQLSTLAYYGLVQADVDSSMDLDYFWRRVEDWERNGGTSSESGFEIITPYIRD